MKSYYSTHCDKCKIVFNTCGGKKPNSFLEDYLQTGGSLNNRSINISIRNAITYFLINFSLHSGSYNFLDAEKTVDNFIEVVRQNVVPDDNVEVQGPVYLVNYQPAQLNVIIELEGKTIWLTCVYRCVFYPIYKAKLRKIYEKSYC